MLTSSVLQFIAGLRNWQKFSFNDRMKFTYKIYDLDGSGYVEPPELVRPLFWICLRALV